jgi:methyltransferase (TIGR00027 family)
MDGKGPSRTALGAAAYRAAHQTVEGGSIFADPLARTILGDDADAIIAEFAAADPTHASMRIFTAARSRIAEDCLALAVARGVRQAVILGAGLDTFALRNQMSPLGVRVFEVDHPETQSFKRQRLAEVGLAIPTSLTFVAVDLQRQGLPSALVSVGFQPDRPAFFHWLGVVPYLPGEAITATLGFIASVPGSEVVFDYIEPLANYPERRRAYLTAVAAGTAALGEPWISFFDPVELAAALREHGFPQQDDLGLGEIAVRYPGTPWGKAEMGPGPHVIRARRVQQ